MGHITKFIVLLFVIVGSGCSRPNGHNLKTGSWRGEFTVEGNKKIPFNFVVEGEDPALKVFLINGEERAELDAVYTKSDSVVVPVSLYDALLIAKVDGDSLHGYFKKPIGQAGFAVWRGPQPGFQI